MAKVAWGGAADCLAQVFEPKWLRWEAGAVVWEGCKHFKVLRLGKWQGRDHLAEEKGDKGRGEGDVGQYGAMVWQFDDEASHMLVWHSVG